jgi:SAM-dependent MidA family methyltransferase
MRLIVEDFLPYDQSSVWRLHDSYFAQCGAEAWTKGFIPYLATSSYAMARQHARMLVSLVAELGEAGVLDPTDEVRVLEVGSGLGRFAAHVARALAADCGDAGRALRERLRYVMSDYSRKNLTDAIEGGPLAELTRLGRVTPALFDLSKPHELHDLAGKALDGTFTAVFANYVCCALPPRIVRKTAEGVFEKLARVGLQEPDDDDSEDADKSAQERWAQLLENPTRQGLLSTVQLAYAWRALAPGQA